jgi:AcrR family transcriptional regulator
MQRRRLGRPPDTTSDETRARVLLAARNCFSEYGYSKTTNKDIAEAAGITTGAIYHYFDSKQSLFAAVTAEVNAVVLDEFERAAAEQDSLVDRLHALLDAASRLHNDDRSLARFSATFPIELNRHPELREHLKEADVGRSRRFYRRLADEASARGELPDDMTPADIANMITAVTVGLAYFGTMVDSTRVHRGAVVTIEKILERGLTNGSPARR